MKKLSHVMSCHCYDILRKLRNAKIKTPICPHIEDTHVAKTTAKQMITGQK